MLVALKLPLYYLEQMQQLVIKSQSDTYKKNFKKFIRPDQIQACH